MGFYCSIYAYETDSVCVTDYKTLITTSVDIRFTSMIERISPWQVCMARRLDVV